VEACFLTIKKAFCLTFSERAMSALDLFVGFTFSLEIARFRPKMDLSGRENLGVYNTHGHKLRFPLFEKTQFVTALGIICAGTDF
jgi:hypothetical protein